MSFVGIVIQRRKLHKRHIWPWPGFECGLTSLSINIIENIIKRI